MNYLERTQSYLSLIFGFLWLLVGDSFLLGLFLGSLIMAANAWAAIFVAKIGKKNVARAAVLIVVKYPIWLGLIAFCLKVIDVHPAGFVLGLASFMLSILSLTFNVIKKGWA